MLHCEVRYESYLSPHRSWPRGEIQMTVLCLIANCQLIQYAPRTAHGDGRRDGDFKWITILPGRALRMRRLQQYAQKTTSGWSLDFLQGSVEVEHRRPASSKVEYRASPEDDLLYFLRGQKTTRRCAPRVCLELDFHSYQCCVFQGTTPRVSEYTQDTIAWSQAPSARASRA